MKTFRATIRPDGNPHRGPVHPNAPAWARPIALLDLQTNAYRIVLRLLWRRKPLYFAVLPFWRGRGHRLLRIGRKP